MSIQSPADNAPHTKLCDICVETKPTGFTMAIYAKWLANFGQRGAIEKSIATLNADFDPGLLNDGICFGCSLMKYDDGEGIVIEEVRGDG